MKKKPFDIMRYIAEARAPVTQRTMADATGYSLGTVNATVSELQKIGYLDESYGVTQAGAAALEPYRVENAIVLAAGMSTRFVPFSFEKPKGLMVVKGEVLIERQIRQLKEAGVEHIVLVLGHMAEKFLYLTEKYGATVVINKDYRHKNTHSSLYYAREHLKNSYVCCADNYFPQSVFHQYEYHSLYSTLYMEGTWRGERGVTTNKDGLIIATQRPAVDQWVMNGFAYFDRNFSASLRTILEEMWCKPGSDDLYWEQVYAEHVKELPLYAVRYTDEQVMEFDSAAELEKFDPDFIKYNDITMTHNICSVLGCTSADIHNIEPIRKGYTNKSFVFSCLGKRYIYRTPGKVSAEWIDRRSEKIALELSKELGINDAYIYTDGDEGWMISSYVAVTEAFDFAQPRHVGMLCAALKKLYAANRRCGRLKDYVADAKELLRKLAQIDPETYALVSASLPEVERIDAEIKADGWEPHLSHNDIYEDNILLEGDKFYLVDWEYAGDNDIGYDLCKLFVKNNAGGAEIDKWLSFYFGRMPTAQERKHIIGCAAISFYYWYVWAVYMVNSGNDYSDLMLKYRGIAEKYLAEYRA